MSTASAWIDGFLEVSLARRFRTPEGIARKGTGCVGDLFSDVLQLLSLFYEQSKLHVSFRGTARFHIPKWEFVVLHDLNSVFLLRGWVILFVCPYFRGELKVSVSRRHVHCLLKKFQPVFYLTFFLLTLEYHQAVILIDSVVYCRAEVQLGFLEKVRSDQASQEI